MAITTDNEKLGVMEMEVIFESGLPLSPGTLGQDDQQQLLLGYPTILYSGPLPGAGGAPRYFALGGPPA